MGHARGYVRWHLQTSGSLVAASDVELLGKSELRGSERYTQASLGRSSTAGAAVMGLVWKLRCTGQQGFVVLQNPTGEKEVGIVGSKCFLVPENCQDLGSILNPGSNLIEGWRRVYERDPRTNHRV